jgi:hypothetical protein
MDLIDRECVRRLLESSDPEATLVFVRGDCQVLPGAEVGTERQGLVIARRKDLEHLTGAGVPVTDQQLDLEAGRLDNVVRDLGA